MYQARRTDGSTLLIQVTLVKIPVAPLKEKQITGVLLESCISRSVKVEM